MNVQKPNGMAQKLTLMIGTFTHWAHVISACVLQVPIISYIEIKFCMCVITQKIFLGSVFICHKRGFHFFPLFSPIAPCQIMYIDNIAYSPYLRPCGLALTSEDAWLLISVLRISLRAWTFVSCFFGVLRRQRSLWRRDFSFRGNLAGVSVCVCV